ncbi:macro domain-containing protein [Agromyces laixinhei]|uniref:macro domain-containing protein n=1 Tax=Agromyces laixinhei TaxID=2585717 RepID=UPI0018DD7656|nr:macro domain-containing protein [Agromyces laixinhei]
MARLVGYFIDDALSADQAADVRARKLGSAFDERALLAALLASRRPGAIPDAVLTELEELLAHERDARGRVEASNLPTLAEQGTVTPAFPVERVAFWRGDLTRLRADAIVNAANDRMLGCFVPGHACIDNAIHAAAGPRLREECAEHIRRQGAPEPTSHAVITDGYQLPAAHVIHTVGPIVQGKLTAHDRRLLADSYRAILDAAAAHPDITTVGLCSVSTGVFGFPKKPAASICLDTIARWFEEHPENSLRIVISLFAEVDEDAYRAALSERTSA